jgi:hypothetical protein
MFGKKLNLIADAVYFRYNWHTPQIKTRKGE